MLIGLTGTFGSGKSTLAAMLAEFGAAIIDADAIAKEVVEPGRPALEEIRRKFGEMFLLDNGSLDRKRLAAEIFSSRAKREALEAIIHPRVREEMRRRIESLRDSAPIIVLNVPLLFEVGLDGSVDQTVVVTVSESERFRRARARDGLREREIVDRLAAQWPQREKTDRADKSIDNSGTQKATRSQARRLYEQWQQEVTTNKKDR